jgi:carboxypeptidase C (cathepsin A)
MKTFIRTLPALMLAASCVHAQEKTAAEGAAKASAAAERPAETKAFDRTLKAESSVTKNSTVTIRGKSVPYKVTAGTQPVWDKDGKVVASLFYTYYQRSDVGDKSRRW